MEPGRGAALGSCRGGGPVVGGSGYATRPREDGTDPRCDCEWEPTDPWNGVEAEA